MAVYGYSLCPVCRGSGVVNKYGENSAWSERCSECESTGVIKVPMTNSERFAGLHTPEDQLKFMRGFVKWAKYAGTPLRLLNPEESDEDMLEWLNKVSDESDDVIFENR